MSQTKAHTHTHTETSPPVSLDISLLKALIKFLAPLEQVAVQHILQLRDSRLLLHTLCTQPHHLLLRMHQSHLALLIVTEVHAT